MEPSTDPQRNLERRRRDVEERMVALRTSIDREIGWLPLAKTWGLPLVGIACGLALASRLRRPKEIRGVSRSDA